MHSNITLIGMSGAGKTTVGKHLARELGYRFIDIDDIIKLKTKLTLKDYIAKYGEEKFIKLEEEIVTALIHLENTVISTGGSIIYSGSAMDYLSKISSIIFLDTPFNLIKSRNKSSHNKGIIGLRDNNFEELYLERCKLYKRYADKIFVPLEVESVKEIALRIKDIIMNLNISNLKK